MGRVSLCLVIMFFICSAQKIDAQVQNIREKQDTISATKSLELKNKGAYVSPPIIHLDYSFDEAVLKLKGREMMPRIYKKQFT